MGKGVVVSPLLLHLSAPFLSSSLAFKMAIFIAQLPALGMVIIGTWLGLFFLIGILRCCE